MKLGKIFFYLLVIYLLFNVFVNKKREYIQSTDPMLIKLQEDVRKLDPRIKDLEFFSSDESYTEDKKKIFICMKDEKGEYYDYNMLMYVTIHEITHALTNVIDIYHVTPQFKNTFESLLSKAYKLGIYDPEKPLYKHYCGLNLNVKKMQR